MVLILVFIKALREWMGGCFCRYCEDYELDMFYVRFVMTFWDDLS